MKPTISIIIPAYNDQAGVDACLDSLDDQSYPHHLFDVIVVDNGSIPRLIVRDANNLQFRVRILVCHTPGSYAARNLGVREATGDLIAFIDADCIAKSDWLDSGITALSESGVDYVIGGEVKMLSPEKPTATALYQLLIGFQQEENIKNKGFSATANLFCFRETMMRIGLFDEKLFSGGDREWAWRARKDGVAVRFCPNAIVETMPRTTLRAAIRQARRIASGRHQLAQTNAHYIPLAGLSRQRSNFSSILLILRLPNLSLLDRLKVLSTAVLIKFSALIELGRIQLGGTAERR